MATFNYLPRELHYGVKNGKDILALERALHKAKCRRRDPSTHFGRICRGNVKTFQKKHGLTVDGVVGPNTSKKLEPYYDDYGRLLIRAYIKNSPSKIALSSKERVVRAAYYALSQKSHIHYRQYRPMADMAPPPNVPNEMDCSQFYTWCFKSAGLPDPNGYGYNGAGNTTSLTYRGHLRLGPAQPADAVLSFWPIEHVSVAVGNGMVISHGREGCPCLEPEFSVNQTRYYIG